MLCRKNTKMKFFYALRKNFAAIFYALRENTKKAIFHALRKNIAAIFYALRKNFARNTKNEIFYALCEKLRGKY